MVVTEAQVVSSFQNKDVLREWMSNVDLGLLFLHMCVSISHKRYVLPAKHDVLHCGPWHFYT
jgi:hypothetical protein